jgi:hypothetical protein
MKDTPNTIFLQVAGADKEDCFDYCIKPHTDNNISWTDERVYDTDVEYIRKSKYKKLKAKFERLKELSGTATPVYTEHTEPF